MAFMVLVSFSAEGELSELLQFRSGVMRAVSSLLKLYSYVLSLLGVGTAVSWFNVGAVVSMVKELTDRVLLVLLALSLTVMVQVACCPSARALKVIVLLSTEAAVVELLQSPYVMVPASFEENV